MDTEREITIQEKVLQRHLDWVKAAETKAQICIPINLAMIGALLALTPGYKLVHPGHFQNLAMGIVLPSLSLVFIFFTFIPQKKPAQGTKPSLIFWGGITKYETEPQYVGELRQRTSETYLADLNTQVYVNARIAKRKYDRVHWAMNLLFAGLVPWLAAAFLLYRG